MEKLCLLEQTMDPFFVLRMKCASSERQSEVNLDEKSFALIVQCQMAMRLCLHCHSLCLACSVMVPKQSQNIVGEKMLMLLETLVPVLVSNAKVQ